MGGVDGRVWIERLRGGLIGFDKGVWRWLGWEVFGVRYVIVYGERYDFGFEDDEMKKFLDRVGFVEENEEEMKILVILMESSLGG